MVFPQESRKLRQDPYIIFSGFFIIALWEPLDPYRVAHQFLPISRMERQYYGANLRIAVFLDEELKMGSLFGERALFENWFVQLYHGCMTNDTINKSSGNPQLMNMIFVSIGTVRGYTV